MADAKTVANQLDGSDGNAALPYAIAAMLYDARMFGLSTDYAFPEGANTSSSRLDQVTTLAKLLTRKMKHADGNSYDLFDAIHTVLKHIIKLDPTINDDEINSVNYKEASQ